VRDLETRIRIMNARAFEERPVTHYIVFLKSRVHIKGFGRNFFAVAVMTKFDRPKWRKLYGLVVTVPKNSWFLTFVNKILFGGLLVWHYISIGIATRRQT